MRHRAPRLGEEAEPLPDLKSLEHYLENPPLIAVTRTISEFILPTTIDMIHSAAMVSDNSDDGVNETKYLTSEILAFQKQYLIFIAAGRKVPVTNIVYNLEADTEVFLDCEYEYLDDDIKEKSISDIYLMMENQLKYLDKELKKGDLSLENDFYLVSNFFEANLVSITTEFGEKAAEIHQAFIKENQAQYDEVKAMFEAEKLSMVEKYARSPDELSSIGI